MTDPGAARPCKYCVANTAGYLARAGSTLTLETRAEDCEMSHRDEPRVYALARALAKVFQTRMPSDEQISWFLEDADEVVDDFDPPPEKWSVRRLRPLVNDADRQIEVRLRVNGVTYVCLEGGKDTRGSVVRLSEFRSWHKEDA